MLSATPKLFSGIEDSHHGPSDAMYNPPSHSKSERLCFKTHGDYTHFYRLSHSELVGIEKVIHIKMVWRYLIPAAAQDKSRFIAIWSYSTKRCKDILKAQVHVSRLLLL
ncbi:hypothetical protein Tco_1069372 [Tanacetum coccineum]|uniref:Uncharacterized protein n=1 Tax=Tanacetum coccineum TaxID=301880 RepID=A0ABQ5HIS2_9ASTR